MPIIHVCHHCTFTALKASKMEKCTQMCRYGNFCGMDKFDSDGHGNDVLYSPFAIQPKQY